MNKIISTIFTMFTILAGIVSMNSCRQQEIEDLSELQMTHEHQMRNASSRTSDTLGKPTNSHEFGESDIDYKDPPPKNGGQWRIKN